MDHLHIKTPYIYIINKLYFYNLFLVFLKMSERLVGVSKTAHARHDAENVVVGRVHTNLGRVGPAHRGVRQDELKGRVVNAREVARARRLVLLRAKGERVHVDAAVRGAAVRLERLDEVKVASLTLREAILTVELKLGRHHRVLTPAVQVKSRLGEDKGARVRNRGAPLRRIRGLRKTTRIDPARNVHRARQLEEARRVNEAVIDVIRTTRRGRVRATKGMDGVRERINRVRVIERLGAEHVEEVLRGNQRRAVVHVGVRLNHPDQLLDGVVEVELDLVGRRTNRLITRELQLLDQVLVGVLGHAPALLGVKEHVINEERRGHQGLVVRRSDLAARG
jgi:hypothetical protein